MMSLAQLQGLPIFISRTEIDSEQRRLEEQWEDQTGDTPATLAEKQNFLRNGRTAFIETQSLMNAIQWTAYVLAGGTVAYPKSAVARGLRASAKALQVGCLVCLTPAARQSVLVQLAAWISCPWPVLQRLSLTSDAEISIASSMGLWWPSACMSCACLLPEAKGGFMHRSDEVDMLDDHVRDTMSTSILEGYRCFWAS